MKKYTLFLLLAFAVLTACSSERQLGESLGELNTLQLKTEQYGNLNLQNAFLAGAIGQIRDITGSTLVNGLDQNGYTTIEVLSENEDGIAMHWLEFYGGIDHPDLEIGSHLSFKDGEFPEDPEALHVQVMGCEGKKAYEWNMDESASKVEIDVLEGPSDDSVAIEYTVTVPNTVDFSPLAEDTSTGRFVLYRDKNTANKDQK